MTTAARTGSPTLLLIPTAIEARELEERGGFEPGLGIPVICGFGPIAAAARAAQIIASLRPARVLLVGIAGTFDAERLPVGAAAVFDAVAIDGIGVGDDEGGFPQWPGKLGETGRGTAHIDDRIALTRARVPVAPRAPHVPDAIGRLRARGGAPDDASPDPALLLSVCRSSGSHERAAERRRRFPGALAEDMEGFGVALACALADVPLIVVRGISNRAGDRDRERWRVRDALAAARELALEVLRAP